MIVINYIIYLLWKTRTVGVGVYYYDNIDIELILYGLLSIREPCVCFLCPAEYSGIFTVYAITI